MKIFKWYIGGKEKTQQEQREQAVARAQQEVAKSKERLEQSKMVKAELRRTVDDNHYANLVRKAITGEK